MLYKTNDPSWKGNRIMTVSDVRRSSEGAEPGSEDADRPLGRDAGAKDATAAGVVPAAKHGRLAGGHGPRTEAQKAVALVLAMTAGLSLILALFVSIAVNSGPNGIRLAVAGPPP